MTQEKAYNILENLIHIYAEYKGIKIQTKNPLTNEWK